MDRNYISNSIACMLLNEDISPMTSAIDYYNYWLQKEKIRITDPSLAVWTLHHTKQLLETDRRLLQKFLTN